MAEAEKAEAEKEVNSHGAEPLYGVCMSGCNSATL